MSEWLEFANSPHSTTARRGGRATKKRPRSINSYRGRDGLPMETKGKPPGLRRASVAARNSLDDAATPPCGDARRGTTPDSILLTSPVATTTNNRSYESVCALSHRLQNTLVIVNRRLWRNVPT